MIIIGFYKFLNLFKTKKEDMSSGEGFIFNLKIFPIKTMLYPLLFLTPFCIQAIKFSRDTLNTIFVND